MLLVKNPQFSSNQAETPSKLPNLSKTECYEDGVETVEFFQIPTQFQLVLFFITHTLESKILIFE